MSRKRQIKKEGRQREELAGRLRDLHRVGADAAFLDLARTGDLPEDGAVAALYGEVVDRALERALAEGDLPQVTALLARLRREATARPWARLAEATIHLEAGRFAEAQGRLAALPVESESGGRPIPERLVADLLAFAARSEEDPTAAESAAPVRGLAGRLTALAEQGYGAGSRQIAELQRAVETLGTALAGDSAARKLCALALQHLALLAELASGDALAARKGERLASRAHQLLDLFRLSSPLLAPLRHALHLRWRELLASLLESPDAGKSELGRLPPALLALDLDGVGGTLERLRTASLLHQLEAAGRHRELAGRLAAESRVEKAPERLAVLWSLELQAWDRADQAEAEDEELDGPPADPACHAALLRIGSMAAAIPGAFPEEQRLGVARFLSAGLLDLLPGFPYCSHLADTTAALLAVLPDDPGLLTLALSVAVVTGDRRGEARLAARIAARGAVRPSERETLLRLAAEAVVEEPEDAVRILQGMRPLAGEEGWPALVDRATQELVDDLCGQISAVSFSSFLGGPRNDFSYLLDVLEVYRPLLGGNAEHAALEVALTGLRDARRAAAALSPFFARQPGLEPALVVLRVVFAAHGPQETSPLSPVLREARAAVVARLDLRWRLWRPQLPALLFGASRAEAENLEASLEALLTQAIESDDREAIENALELAGKLKKLTTPPPRPRARRKRRRANDRQADLFS